MQFTKMKILSTNIAKPKSIEWNGKTITTGIFKSPINLPIYLDTEAVKGDEISDRKVHGGEYKACYLFSADNYPYWKNLYPHLQWADGMFGENLTVTGLNEKHIHIGDIYKIGTALVQVTQPREPCYKLGVKFGNQVILKEFIAHGYPGTYVRVLEKGYVSVGDTIELVQKAPNSVSTFDFFKLLYSKEKDQALLASIVNNEALPIKKRSKLSAFLKS
ncbi:MOSC domain-containing protein [Geojedonia litorea]|uniref:MOSC domain-containing protein n=1 Tax=Geojedonia litorea TaxID=1268269 RepID=A0ABV9MYL3_9FLAO